MVSSFAKITALILLLAACAPGGLNAEESLGTARVMAATQINETQRAAPTNTQPQPPTLTPPIKVSDTPFPVFTPLPTLTATATVRVLTNTPWVNPNEIATLRFENNSKQNIFAVISGSAYGEYSFSDSWNLMTPWGDYDYLVWIGEEGPFAGSFAITNRDKHTLVIETDKVHFEGP
jgi:hypothetical protein